jgi:type IV pilus assembly protein PilV
VKSFRAKGFTLLEALVALVILTVGLLGVASLVGNSVRTNNASLLRAQAAYMATNMADRMRANTNTVIAGTYDGTGYTGTGSAPDCNAGAPCNGAQLAARDTVLWGRMLASMLPAGSGDIACNIGAVPGGVVGTPIVPGTCRIIVNWNESTNEGAIPFRFDLVFQP